MDNPDTEGDRRSFRDLLSSAQTSEEMRLRARFKQDLRRGIAADASPDLHGDPPMSDLHGGGDVSTWEGNRDGILAIPTTGVRAARGLRIASLVLPALIFLVALAPRLIVIFFVTDPQNPGLGWYGDVYHHWQIAYLSKEVGFSQGFLRLWDFKGMEFFWGLLHPLVLIGLFTITGSVDIVIPRLLSAFLGAMAIPLMFLLLKRYFGTRVALAGVLLAGFNPISIYSDAVGMQEPLGLVLLLSGLLILRKQPMLAGVAWGMAGMVRAEYWVFGAGLLVVAIISGLYHGKSLSLAIGWVIPSLLYMKYMLDYTGNPIYPIYWNYLAGTAGRWIEDIPINAEQARVQLVARIILVAALAFAGWLLWRRPRPLLFLLLGLGNIIMLGIVLGLGEYIRGYVSKVLVDRLVAIPYGYVGMLIAIGFLYILPKHLPEKLAVAGGWLGVAIIFAASQLAWDPILGFYEPLRELWYQELELADQVAFHYREGTIAIPEDRQALTYALVRYHDIEGEDLEGQMYDPFSYMQGDPFEDWQNNREVIKDWFARRNITLLVFYDGKPQYEEMIRREPDWFDYRTTTTRKAIDVYRVQIDGSSD